MIWDLRQLLIEQQRQQAQNFSSALREEVNRLEYILSGKIENALADHGKEEGILLTREKCAWVYSELCYELFRELCSADITT